MTRGLLHKSFILFLAWTHLLQATPYVYTHCETHYQPIYKIKPLRTLKNTEAHGVAAVSEYGSGQSIRVGSEYGHTTLVAPKCKSNIIDIIGKSLDILAAYNVDQKLTHSTSKRKTVEMSWGKVPVLGVFHAFESLGFSATDGKMVLEPFIAHTPIYSTGIYLSNGYQSILSKNFLISKASIYHGFI